MSVDFFNDKCSNVLSDKKFGLCDKDDLKAYTDTYDKDSWLATVDNGSQYDIKFIAVDKCIELTNEDGDDYEKCDAIMTYSDNIIFIELKNRKGRSNNNWINKGEAQLRSTIKYFSINHDIGLYTTKTAYISNKRKPYFRTSQKDRMTKFYKETKVIFKIMATIEV